MSLIDQIVSNKKVLIQVSDWNDYHKHCRESDLNEASSYITLFFIYHYIPMWRKTKPKISHLLGEDIRILNISDYDGGLGSKFMETKTLSRNDLSTIDFKSYDVIINSLDTEINNQSNGGLGLEEKINAGEIELRPDTIYIGYKSSNWKKRLLNMYQMKIRQTMVPRGNIGVYKFTSLSKERPEDKSEIIFGPWPLYHVDFESFPPWPGIKD